MMHIWQQDFSTPNLPRGVFSHEYGEDHYHDHDDYALDHNPEEDGLWQADNVELISVGIDIGSSGTQVVFSRIMLQRSGGSLSSRYFVVSREQLYQSPVSLTPYAAGLLIDKAALGQMIDTAYGEAGIAPSQVDTGAVILTGEALRRENAHNIADILAVHGGNFVCTMAGHHIEAMLAAYGSGAAWASNAQHKRILNIDIGGGTTKFALIEAGRVTATAALHIGGRLHVFDSAGRLTRLELAAWRYG
jgi:ethanolamine utilization protein EutA